MSGSKLYAWERSTTPKEVLSSHCIIADAASDPIRLRSHRFVGDVSGSLILRRAGSWMKGALQANGRAVSTPVGSTT